ncbi:MAG: F0F1 ATP synthase subunit epsilon [Methylobacterium sp.]|nr:F0F1 ATP synthase subunit epsilon [Methylobacterium sp.]MCA3639377.1 F0F1 ATP synthase subunit epsilon [Methylobacterium sp.]
MASFNFELVSPERVLFAGDVNSVVVPAAEGDVTVLANHAPFMSAVRPGVVTVDGGRRLFVRGGFLDVNASGLTLLAEQAVPVEEIDREKVAAEMKAAEDELRAAMTDDARALVSERIAALGTMMAAVRS